MVKIGLFGELARLRVFESEQGGEISLSKSHSSGRGSVVGRLMGSIANLVASIFKRKPGSLGDSETEGLTDYHQSSSKADSGRDMNVSQWASFSTPQPSSGIHTSADFGDGSSAALSDALLAQPTHSLQTFAQLAASRANPSAAPVRVTDKYAQIRAKKEPETPFDSMDTKEALEAGISRYVRASR